MKRLLFFSILSASAVFADTDLEKEFDEAFHAGRPLEAENAFRRLSSERPNLPPIRFFQAAEVSRQLGKTVDCRTRLSHYVKVEKVWNESVEAAAWNLCMLSRDADAFVLLVSKVAPSRALFRAARDLLQQYRKEKRSADFTKVVTAALGAFRADSDRAKIFAEVAQMVSEGSLVISDEGLRDLVERNPPRDLSILDPLFNARGSAFSTMWKLRMMSSTGALLSPAALESCGKFGTNVNVRTEAAKIVMRFAPIAFDGKHGRHAAQLLRLKAELSDMIFSPDQTNEMSAAFCADFDKVVTSDDPASRDTIAKLMLSCASNQKWVPLDIEKVRDRYPQFIVSANYISDTYRLSATCQRANSTKPYHDILPKCPNQGWTRYAMLQTLAKLGDTTEVKKCFVNELISRDSNPSYEELLWGLVNSKMTDKQIADILSFTYSLTGSHPFWDWCREHRSAQRHPALTNTLAKAAIAKTKKDAKSNSRLVEIRREMYGLKRGAGNKAPDRAHELFDEACGLFKEKWPQRGKWESRVFGEIAKKYADLCQYNGESAARAIKALTPKVDPACEAECRSVYIDNLLWNCSGASPEAMIELARVTQNAAYLINIRLPKDTTKLPVPVEEFRKLSSAAVVEFISRNWHIDNPAERRASAELEASLLAVVFKNFNSVDLGSYDVSRKLFQVAGSVARAQPQAVASLPFDKIASEVFDKNVEPSGISSAFIAFCAGAGKLDAYLQRYLADLVRREPHVRLTQLLALGEMSDVITFGDAAKGTIDRFDGLFTAQIMPAIKAVPTKSAPFVWLGSGGDDGYLGKYVLAWGSQESRKANPRTKQMVDEFFREYVRLMNAGARGLNDWCGRDKIRYYRHVYTQGLDTTNAVLLAQVAHPFGRVITRHAIGDDTLANLLKRTKDEEMWEPLYLLASEIVPERDNNKSAIDMASRFRLEASSHLPGVYPVTEKDPLYPLYVAADEFTRNNFERAAELLAANLPAFERDAVKLPPAFAAWAVDQMRQMRGKNDETLVRARALATKLLGDETKLTPDLAAAMLLVRAESFRDQQNFEAAKLEYQSIRNNAAYSKTPVGRRAMFRAIDLMIDTGNASAAEPTLEYWLSQPDTEIQAQAHYFLARIAFERKDYDECIKRLREVFAIDFTHTEARFLHGQWKLATNNEVDETEVMVGSLSDRTAVRPGQQLSITVQDRNLSVAGGGSSIPIVVRASPGGDKETIRLTPSSRDPGLFKGAIDVRLAAPVASNLVLEVTGADTVTYAIDADFLAARGLPPSVPKSLTVVDDARLAIGAGAPKVAEADSAAQVAALVGEGGGGDETMLARSLRPGNPLHIAVSDKDRSFGRPDGSIFVEVTTSSGDRIANVSLKETELYSGVFRGVVRTALPPPRAFASDTAVGFNPGDVINSNRGGSWRSLADGLPGKWFEVDTMGSHLFSNIVVKMSAPESITALRLTGTLAGEEFRLGTFPATDPEKRIGLKSQMDQRRGFRGERSVRDYMESTDAPRAVPAKGLFFEPPRLNTPSVLLLSGVFAFPDGLDFMRLRIKPKSKSTNAMKYLWLAIALDGKTVFSGSSQQLIDALVSFEASSGIHRLEIFATGGENDGFEILWEPTGEEAVPVPLDWFDVAKHPEIRSFVTDRAKITRTEDGFTAEFAEPVRLRTIRWNFLGRRGPDVSIDSLSAIDSEGKTILPVASDFSDAQHNDTLEVAPGDRIFVSYVDDRTTRGSRRKIEKTMQSSFSNATVGFYFENEDYVPGSSELLHEAYRFVPGDQLVVSVSDSDLDATDEADSVDVTVSTLKGKRLSMKLVERPHPSSGSNPSGGIHTGRFMGLLKTVPAGGKDGVTGANVIETSDSDELRVEYMDRENTNPGVPVVRSAKVGATPRTKPVVTLFRSEVIRAIDDSPLAKSRLEAIRRRPGNEDVTNIYREDVFAEPLDQSVTDTTNPIVMNVNAPLLVRVNDPSRARHSASFLKLEAVSESEIELAEEEGFAPEVVPVYLKLGGPFGGVKLKSGNEPSRTARLFGSFNGMIRLVVGTSDSVEEVEADPDAEKGDYRGILAVNGTDTVRLQVKDGEEVLAERIVTFAADATLDLVDSTLSAERKAVHCGERFFVCVRDADCDTSDEADRIEIAVRGVKSGCARKLTLVETLPHSGIFSGVLRPVIFPKDGMIPSVVTGGVATAAVEASDDRFPVRYGESIEFSYVDTKRFSADAPRTLCATGTVHEGSDGMLRLFSKRFRDVDEAVLVQFRLAECLFEQAKEFRRRKEAEKSADAIARGRFILEEALKNYPDTSHAAQGEFLLANLYQELAAESHEAGDEEKSRRLYTEALSRFSSMLAVAPKGEYAPRAQYHKALCLEKLGDFRHAGEEYVKMTYLYPESPLVADATVRLATHYYKNEKRYDVSARIYENFQKRFPNHEKASRALFMCGSCYVKQAEKMQAEAEESNNSHTLPLKVANMYLKAQKAFETMAETYRTDKPEMRAQALYWAGDAALRRRDAKNAYLFLKRTVLEYPETEWARRARGLLLQESDMFDKL